MNCKWYAKSLINTLLRPFGHELEDWSRRGSGTPEGMNPVQTALPEGAEAYLRPDNPRLLQLGEKYAAWNRSVMAPSVWTDVHLKPADIKYFRGDNAFVWQLRGQNMQVLSYILTAYYVRSIDSLGLLDTLVEDDCFGNLTCSIGNRTVSRDLLDSIMEIYFLEKHLGISSLDTVNVLDIGAGYGRLAYRAVKALPNIGSYFCTDAVAASTFISEYYLRFRGLEGKAKAVPLDEIERTLETRSVDLAINIHSFSECRIPAIDWWLSLLEKKRVRYLMIVPNTFDNGGTILRTNDGGDIRKVIERHGYTLRANEPKYRDPAVQKYGINPTWHYLFERSGK